MKDRLIELMQQAENKYLNLLEFEKLILADYLIKNGVTIREQAHWEVDCDGYYPYCSNCRHEPEGRKMTKFCENCGAEMKGGAE